MQIVGGCWGTGVPHPHSLYVPQRVSQEGQINWTRSMETYVWYKKKKTQSGCICSLHLSGNCDCFKPLTIWDTAVTFKPASHSFISNLLHPVSFYINPPFSWSIFESCSEDGYPAIFLQVSAAGDTLRDRCSVGDPEPRGCCREELRRHAAGVRGEGVQHRHRSADSNIR